MKISFFIELLRKVSIFKTIVFNVHYFPLKVAVRFPAIIYRRTKLANMGGALLIPSPPKMGMLRIGPHGLAIKDKRFERTIWDVQGTIVLEGVASIGSGSKINVGLNAILKLGDKFMITGNSEIVCHKKITFGNNCLLSWDVLVMDTDFHSIVTYDGEIINNPKSIVFGNHIWVGCRSTILKGVHISDDNVISANSTVTRDVDYTNSIIGGHGKSIGVIKNNVNWIQ